MSYATRPEPITYWHIMWYDMTESRWPTKLWSIEQLSTLASIAAFIEVDERGYPIP